jgi:hypothetical protein
MVMATTGAHRTGLGIQETATGLVLVLCVKLLMTSFFFLSMNSSAGGRTKRPKGMEVQAAYLGISMPSILCILRQISPLLSNDPGDIGVPKAWILSHHCGLVMLPV